LRPVVSVNLMRGSTLIFSNIVLASSVFIVIRLLPLVNSSLTSSSFSLCPNVPPRLGSFIANCRAASAFDGASLTSRSSVLNTLCRMRGLRRFSFRVLCSVKNRPVPGSPTVDRIPVVPKVILAPRPPTEIEPPLLLKLSVNPGAIRTRRKNRKDMVQFSLLLA
jgi:hypothetical protein